MRKGVWRVSARSPRLRTIVIPLVIVILAAIVLFVRYVIFPPPFDEQRVIGLLSRHDAALAKAEFEWMDVIYEDGQTVNEFGSYNFFNDSGTLLGWRGADVRRDETGVLDGRMLVISGSTRPVAFDNTSTKWRCANNTTLELTTAATPAYLYVGATGNALTHAMLKSLEGEATIAILSSMQEMVDAINATLENASQTNLSGPIAQQVAESRAAMYKLQNAIDAAEKGMITSEVWYFRPDQMEEFEETKARFMRIVADCEIAA
jgi:hypothetical protein